MYIVIEAHPNAESATIVTDEEGNNLVFTDYVEAEEEVEKCQDGLIVFI